MQKMLMRLMVVFNVIRIVAIVVICVAIVISYLIIMFDEDAYFELKVVQFLNLIVLELAIIFLELLSRF